MTTIISIINSDGSSATAAEIWNRPSSALFEIIEGPHAGKRGPSDAIFDLVGPITWNQSEVSIRETGERLPAWMVPNER